jgi:2-amino-4-hydroxy-6-hydroxymethyldihydropteridine diphosphokinase
MNGVFLLLGTNIGDRLSNLQKATQLIDRKQSKVLKKSSIYKTAAWGKEDQPDFLNQVLEIETGYTPHQLLHEILGIETAMGRIRIDKWAERIIDIDILLFNNEVIHSPVLIVPHPQLPFRRFTLMPLAEIAPSLIHPVEQKKISELLADCEDPLAVEKLVL